jgi:hypothetical protein
MKLKVGLLVVLQLSSITIYAKLYNQVLRNTVRGLSSLLLSTALANTFPNDANAGMLRTDICSVS